MMISPSANVTGSRRRWLVALAAIGALVVLASAPSADAERFSSAPPTEIPQIRLFDIGTTDYNGDGLLDLFTTNHKSRGVLLRNDGGGGFTDVLAEIGLSPTPAFPGLEYLRKPAMNDQAVYIYATDSLKAKQSGVIHLRSVGKQASGTLSFGASEISITRADGAQVRRGTTAAGQPSVDFTLRPGAELGIRADHIDLPIAVAFQDPLLPLPLPGGALQPGDIRVGTLARPATSRRFVLNLRDRHGFVFADLIRDGGLDVFAVTGGLGGQIKLPGYKDKIQDELLVGEGGRLQDRSAGSGLSKGSCRARQAAAVDIDANGLLDLFESCEGEPPKVYLKRTAGPFSSAGSPRVVANTYRWVNLGGRKPELLAATERGIEVLRREHRRWRSVQRIRDNAYNGQVSHFSVGDLANDGDLDVLAAAQSGNTLLRNDRGRLREVPMQRLGLPPRSLFASFVDYDNDGYQDLDLVPQGLYHGTPRGAFRRTGELSVGKHAGAAITTWFDADNDGLRDPLIVVGKAEFAPRMTVIRKRNTGPGGHWLEVDLTGEAGNRQAIGARVAVRAGGRWQYQWVGQNDDSRHSQGHYRLYFGLGEARKVDALAINWPDGRTKRLHDVAPDRLLRIARP